MVVHEYGTQNRRYLLFFQGSCEPWQEFSRAAELLAAEYHVLLVTPDGHDPEEHTDFISVEQTVEDTARWLHSRGIGQLDALYGLSFGGGMAVRFLTTQDIPVRKAVIDAGTAPYGYPRWICRLIGARDYLMLKIARNSIAAMKAAFPPERFARDRSRVQEEYGAIRQYLKGYSDRTIWNIFWSANNYAVPEKAPDLDTRIQFWVGTDEWGSRYRDLKWYRKYLPRIEVVKIPGMMHGELVLMHPEEFSERALEFFEG